MKVSPAPIVLATIRIVRTVYLREISLLGNLPSGMGWDVGKIASFWLECGGTIIAPSAAQ
jgi:hypothetical protein